MFRNDFEFDKNDFNHLKLTFNNVGRNLTYNSHLGKV